MGTRDLNRGQRIVIVVGLAIALDVFGQWVTTRGQQFGWVAYAPLSSSSVVLPGGLHPWVRMLVWLALTAIWVVTSVALLRSRRPEDGRT